MDESAVEPRVESRGGALLTKYRPVFTEDGKNILCCCGHDVKIYSVKTGKCIGVLKGHTDFVTAVQLNPRNSLQVFTSSLDRLIISWDHTDRVRLKTYRVGFPIVSMSVANSTELMFYTVCQEAKNHFTVKKVTPPADSAADMAEAKEIINNIADSPNALTVGPENRYVAAVSGSNLIVYKTKKKTTRRLHTMDRRRLTCVAAHPRDDRLATGCAHGSIVLWWNFMSEDDSPVHTSIHHWHSLSVLTLAFTQEGTYLLSGGHECVLVVWQDDMHNQDFLPRLGAPIAHVGVSRDNTSYVTAHSDNMVQIISNSLQVRQVIQGLTRHCSLSAAKTKKQDGNRTKEVAFPRTGLQLDPRTNALVLNGRPGHLQFYNVLSDDLVFNLDIVSQNYISPDDVTHPIAVTEIDACALSENGEWLATAQSREDPFFSLDLCLKFWKFDDVSQSYALNTFVDMAHQKPISCIRFRPGSSGGDDCMCVTTSRDGRFKLWALRDDTDIYRENVCWDCDSVGFYRDQAATTADFSEDGSVLCVAFNDVVTLWNPETNALKTTLQCRDKITHLLTGRAECRHLLVACTKNVLMVWNLLTIAVEWIADSSVITLVRDPTSANMAAFTHQRELFVFSPNNAKPTFATANVSRYDVTTAVFVPRATSDIRHRWMAGARLYFMDQDQKLLTIGCGDDRPADVGADVIDQKLHRSVLSQTLSKSLAADREVVKLESKPVPAFNMFDAPAHTLPPVTNLTTTFLHSLLVPQRKDGAKDDDSDASDDDDMEVDAQDSDSDTDQVRSKKTSSAGETSTEKKPVETDTVLRQLNSLNVNDVNWLTNHVKDVTVVE